MIPSNPLQTEPEIGNDYYYAACAVCSNAHHQYTKALLFSIDRVDKPLPNAAKTLEDQHCEEPGANNHILIVLHRLGIEKYAFFSRQLEEYSNEAHLFAVMAANQYSETLPDTNLQNKDDSSPDFEGKDDDKYPLLWNHTRAPIISKDLIKLILENFLTVQFSTGCHKCATILNFVFVHVQFIPSHRGKK
jgi:hypothetical protein